MKIRQALALTMLLVVASTAAAGSLERDREGPPFLKRFMRVIKSIVKPLDSIIVPPHP